MSEEEIIDYIKDEIELLNIDDNRTLEISPILQKELAERLRKLLDLYNKEKTKRIKYGNILFAHNLVEDLEDFFEE